MRLKRYKVIYIILNILIFPIRFPLFILFKIGEISEKVLDFTDILAYKFMSWIVKIFKFEEIAKEQYKVNKNKFKRKGEITL